MKKSFVLSVAILILLFIVLGCSNQPQESSNASANEMSFFITSTGPGNGADLLGLAGADAYCQKLAESAGSKGKTWHAYLSASGKSSIDARDRIGKGPWHNAKGELVANDVADLHNNASRLVKTTQLNEKGEIVNGRGDSPNRHDILTGSNSDGTLFVAGTNDTTCSNWMSSTNGTGNARVGHHDRIGGGQDPTSWNSAHNSRGCSQENLRSTGGDGLFYCFAIN
ncbi:MAG TPA: lectin [Candidatus Nanoarchaeia archaeon]|nr:lectin [Candidatus Nanoarchaeia archaeon]